MTKFINKNELIGPPVRIKPSTLSADISSRNGSISALGVLIWTR